VNIATVLGLAYALSEVGLGFKKRARAGDSRGEDRGSLRLYTGALMACLGLALCLANWTSVMVTMIPVLSVFLWRMHVEAALLQAFGDRYREYMNRTKRLIPALY
jgi:hypothetical protein